MTINDIHGWFDYKDIYIDAVRRCPEGGTLVELGVWCGKSLAFLAREAVDRGRDDIKIFGIDLWQFNDIAKCGWDGYAPHEFIFQRKVKDVCEDNLSIFGLRERVTLIQSDTIEAASQFTDGSVDFVWFDANHEADHVRREIAAWLPKFRRPTWCAGHDVESPGLFDAVRQHFPDAQKVPGMFGSWRTELPLL